MCAERLRRERGFSIIEIMVGIVVALLVGLAASSSARFFTASQRQGMAVGAMSSNVLSALGAIKTDVASAGLGFFGDSYFSCYKMNFSVGSTKKYENADFTPVLITRDGANDTLEVLSSTSIDGGANVLLSGVSNGTVATTQSRLPAKVGDAVMLVPGKPAAGLPCMIRRVTDVTELPQQTGKPAQTFTFGVTGDYNQVVFGGSPTYVGNNPDRDRMSLLGTLYSSRYALDGTKLMYEQPLTGLKGTLLSNVLAFRVQYGISADDKEKTLVGWQDATGSTWSKVSGSSVDRVRALRIGIVTRSPAPEKRNAEGNCEASGTKPVDPFDSSVTVEPDVSDWQCYRYRTAVQIVPLRNLVW